MMPIAERYEQLAKVVLALEKFDEGMAAIGGCGDGNCVIVRPKGMHTNGGCHCYSDRMKAMRAMSRGRWLAEEIRKAVA